MITTFERLAKIIKGEAAPANRVESAFSALASAVSNIPAVTNSDRGKFLGVNASNNNLGWKAIRQVPAVEDTDKDKYLHTNVSTGALEWASAGGGGGGGEVVFEGTVTITQDTGTLVFTPNNWSYSDIESAISVGQYPIVIATMYNGDAVYKSILNLYLIYGEEGANSYTFTSNQIYADGISGNILIIDENDHIDYNEYNFSLNS